MKKEILKTIIDNIKINDYENFGYDEINGSCYLMNQNGEFKWTKIFFEINIEERFLYIKTHGFINFLSVTKILNKIFEIEYPQQHPYLWENADTLTINNELFQKINSKDIRPTLKLTMTEDDVKKFYNQIQFLFDEYFQKYSDLKSVNNEIIGKIPQMELGAIIPGVMHFKKQVIMKICGNSEYQNYIQWLENVYEEDLKNPNDIFYKQNKKEYEIFKKLTKYLHEKI